MRSLDITSFSRTIFLTGLSSHWELHNLAVISINYSGPVTMNAPVGISTRPVVWYGMVWYGMVWYGMVWYGTVWYGMVWYGMVWYGTVRYGMVWYGMVCPVVWYGMVWYGMVCPVVWYGMSGGMVSVQKNVMSVTSSSCLKE